jgi:HD-like signal output (HDOD) protein
LYLRKAWKQSTDVAALSAMIARSATRLESDGALLAGLTHCIGLSPILVKAEGDSELLNNADKLERILCELYPAVGGQILKTWGFSDQLVEVPLEHLNTERSGNDGEADYVDIVQVALIQTLDDDSHPLANIDQADIGAFDRLGMHDGLEEISMIGGVIEIEEIKTAIL